MPRIAIESLDDPRVAAYHDLKTKRLVRDGNLFIAEGTKLVERLLASDFRTESVLIAERRESEWAAKVPADVPLYVIPQQLGEQLTGFNFHVGVLACGRRKPSPLLEDILARTGDTGTRGAGDEELLRGGADDCDTSRLTVVICPNCDNPENLGAIIRIGAAFGIDALLVAMAELRGAFEAKAAEFKSVLKIGRTQLQDAVPMTLGQEFLAFAIMIGEDEARLREARALITEVNLGATAIGTGINAPAGYAEMVIPMLAVVSGVPVVKAANLVEATQDTGAFVQLSGVLKRVACKLSKICNDLRLLSSGPQAGFGDIKLPARQAGSSIMPGKVNPVIPEVMNQVAFEVIGNDVTITMASEAGQLQLNAFEPIMGWALFKSVKHLTNACKTLQVNCVEGIEANHALLAKRVAESVTLVTALNPIIGYEKAALIAKTALATGGTIADVAESLGIMSRAEMNALLVPEKLTQPVRLVA